MDTDALVRAVNPRQILGSDWHRQKAIDIARIACIMSGIGGPDHERRTNYRIGLERADRARKG